MLNCQVTETFIESSVTIIQMAEINKLREKFVKKKFETVTLL